MLSKRSLLQLRYLSVLLLLVAVLILMIAGAASPWYRLPLQPSGKLKEFLTFMSYNGKHCFYADGNCPLVGEETRLMFGLILSGVIASHLLVCLQMSLRWRERLWFPLLTITCLATLVTTGTWSLLYLHPSSLAADMDAKCNDEQAYFCDFSGAEFGPDAGWVLFLVSSLVMYGILLVLPFFGASRKVPQAALIVHANTNTLL